MIPEEIVSFFALEKFWSTVILVFGVIAILIARSYYYAQNIPSLKMMKRNQVEIRLSCL